MRIGIITHHWVPNFGANLQTLATYRWLLKAGHEAVILNWHSQDLENMYNNLVPSNQRNIHDSFCQDFIKQSSVCYSEDDLIHECSSHHYDGILTGSDAVFRISLRKIRREDKAASFPNPFWLTWVQRCPQTKPSIAAIAASSMGTKFKCLPKNIRDKVRIALEQMKYISVRDSWTRQMVISMTMGMCQPEICPDPVSILDDVFVVPESEQAEPHSLNKQYVLISCLDGMLNDAWIGEFVRLVHKRGLKVFSLPLPEGECRLLVDRVLSLPMSPLNWYSWIKNSAGFIGVRFHPIVCAIFSGIPFVSFDIYSTRWRGILQTRMPSKVYDLCARSGTKEFCLSGMQKRLLTPEKTLRMLMSPKQEKTVVYAKEARKAYSRIMTNTLRAFTKNISSTNCMLGNKDLNTSD